MQANSSDAIVDGYEGFLFVNQCGNPRTSTNLEDALKSAVERHNRTSEVLLPKITPHVLRHTFCTNMANAGMEVKSLQYIMGHANCNMTLDVYSHINYETARASMQRILDAEVAGQ